ncbi:MAG: hypothetical protein V4662_01020, partial [Verrucomicrobiota bacterium]
MPTSFAPSSVPLGQPPPAQSGIAKMRNLLSNKQLLVPDTNGQLIASGVSSKDFERLEQSQPGVAADPRVQDAADRILAATGIPTGHVATMPADKRCTMAKAIASQEPCAPGLIAMEIAVSQGQMNAALTGQVLELNTHSPKLAGKLANIGKDEANHANNVRPGTTAFVAEQAMGDTYFHDKQGTAAQKTPSADQLGFEPKLHIQFPREQRDQYDALKTQIGTYQAQNLMTKANFDDKNQRVDLGYSSEELALQRTSAMQMHRINPRDMTGPINSHPDMSRDLLDDSNLMVNTRLGNRNFLDKLQDTRLDTTKDIYTKLDNFNFAPHDQRFDDATCADIETKLAEPGVSNQEVLNHLLTTQDMPGIVIAENHGQTDSKNFITDNMPTLAQQGVGIIGIEHFSNPEVQKSINAYLDEPQGTQMSAELNASLRGLRGGETGTFVDLVNAAKENNMKVIGIDAPNLRTPEGHGPNHAAIRAAFMNIAGINELDKELANGNGPAPKFVLLAGAAHNSSQVGLLQNGVPGLGQYYQAPNIEIGAKTPGTDNYAVNFVRDDPTRRHAVGQPVPANAINVAQNNPPGPVNALPQAPGPLAPINHGPPQHPAPPPPGQNNAALPINPAVPAPGQFNHPP